MFQKNLRDMVKKDILLNGVVVGQHEATGDLRKDAEAVQTYLKEKGLYREITRTDAIHGQANSFASVANSLYDKDLKRSPFKGRSISPFIVNAALSIELYLKAIHSAYSKEIKGHHLENLYQRLPDEAKAIFEASAADLRPRYKLELGADIHSCLRSLSKAFEQWRYVYEYNGIGTELQGIRYTMHVSHEACCRARKATET
jgi:HEPN domain-containing protein